MHLLLDFAKLRLTVKPFRMVDRKRIAQRSSDMRTQSGIILRDVAVANPLAKAPALSSSTPSSDGPIGRIEERGGCWQQDVKSTL
jgi:hypothetical protein